jgi:hypothetical protein
LKSNKITTFLICETSDEFRHFYDESDFPNPEPIGKRGSVSEYPECLSFLIANLSVEMKIMTCAPILKITIKDCDVNAQVFDLKPISERQLRKRPKNSSISLENMQAAFIFPLFPELDN